MRIKAIANELDIKTNFVQNLVLTNLNRFNTKHNI